MSHVVWFPTGQAYSCYSRATAEMATDEKLLIVPMKIVSDSARKDSKTQALLRCNKNASL